MANRLSSILLLLLLNSNIFSQELFDNPQVVESVNIPSSNAFGFNGYIRSVIYFAKNPVDKTVNTQALYVEPSLLLNAKYGKVASAHAELRFKSGYEWQTNVNEIILKEAYTDMYISKIDVRLGKQIINWGNTTLLNSNGRFTPTDPTIRSPEESDIQKSIWALKIGFQPFDFLGISSVWQPIYTPTTLLLDLIPIPQMVSFEKQTIENSKFKIGSYGIKTEIRTAGVDFSFSWFDGFCHLPGLIIKTMDLNESTFLPEAIVIQEKPYRIHSLGANFVIPINNWLFRGEASFMSPYTKEDSVYIPLRELCYTVEIEKTVGGLTLITGYYGKWLPNFTALTVSPMFMSEEDYANILGIWGSYLTPELVTSMVSNQVTAFNRLYSYQMDKTDNQVYIAASLSLLHDIVTLETPIIINLNTKEMFAKIAIKYFPTDGITLSAGFNYMGGNKESLYNIVGPYLNGLWFSMRYGF